MMSFDVSSPFEPMLNAEASQPFSLPSSTLLSSIERADLNVSRSASRERSAPIATDPIAPTLAGQSVDVFADFDLAGLNAVLALTSSAVLSEGSTLPFTVNWTVPDLLG